MHVCYNCNIELTDDNWMSSFKKRNQKICSSCYSRRFNSKNNKVNNPLALYVDNKYISRKDPLYKILKPGRYKTEDGGILNRIVKEDATQEGYVYIITNPAWPGWVKIGMAEDVQDRVNQFQTSSPHRDYEIQHSVYTSNRREAEKLAHRLAKKKSTKNKKEWFLISLELAIEILNSLDVTDRKAA